MNEEKLARRFLKFIGYSVFGLGISASVISKLLEETTGNMLWSIVIMLIGAFTLAISD